MVEVENGNLIRLTQGGRGYSYPVWSPNSDQIIFSSRDNAGGLYLLNVNARTQKLITDEDSSAETWSPDEKYIAFVNRADNITAYNVNEAKSTQLTTVEAIRYDLNWSPDSQQLVFI